MKGPIVSVKQGKLLGKEEEDIRGGKFYSFKSIPYAKPPVGELRFKAPQPADSWKDIRNATDEANACCQYDPLTKQISGSEDCLYLSIYTPQLPRENCHQVKKYLKPVMVFIHGGAFIYGSNKSEVYGPEFLIAEDIVLVVINYRLGIIGLLSVEDQSLDVPGNAAFKDMVLALKWVQENISNFCGDANNVTIFGESAGGASVHLLMLSPLAKGLFHKVIAQSGCALNGWIFSRRETRSLCENMGFKSNDEKEMLKFLRHAQPEDIVRAQRLLEHKDYANNSSRYLGLTIEQPSPGAFMTENPLNIVSRGNYTKIPLMMGYNTNEGMLFEILVNEKRQAPYWEDPEIHVPIFLNLSKGSALSKVVGERIAKFYQLDGSLDRLTLKKHLYKVTTENAFMRGIYTSVKMHVQSGLENVFLYRMAIETELNLFKVMSGIKDSGVCHADDLGYLFKNVLTPEIKSGSTEDIAQRRFARLWTNFAKYGHPTPLRDPVLGIDWKPVKRGAVNYLDIGQELELGKDPEAESMAFWDEIYSICPADSKL